MGGGGGPEPEADRERESPHSARSASLRRSTARCFFFFADFLIIGWR